MSIDMNISEFDMNGCLFIDNPKPPQYWLSPNLIMTTTADPNGISAGNNTTSVTVSWKAECGFTGVASQINKARFDLYVGDPFIAMAPASMDTLANASLTTPPLTSGQLNVATTVGPWNAATLPHLSQAGHACLLARVYPEGASPDTGNLAGYPPEDLHYAQHNCTVNTSDGQGLLRIPIVNGTVRRGPQLVAIQAVPDLKPGKAVLDAVMPSLRQIPAFKQIAAAPLAKVDLDFSQFKSHHESLLDKIEDWLEKKVNEIICKLEDDCNKNNGASRRIMLPPDFFGKFNFIADLSGTNKGDAHIYHISQVNEKGEPYGGITAVIVVT